MFARKVGYSFWSYFLFNLSATLPLIPLPINSSNWYKYKTKADLSYLVGEQMYCNTLIVVKPDLNKNKTFVYGSQLIVFDRTNSSTF